MYVVDLKERDLALYARTLRQIRRALTRSQQLGDEDSQKRLELLRTSEPYCDERVVAEADRLDGVLGDE